MFKRPYGVSPTVDITIAGVPVSYKSITGIKVILEENKHDYLEMTMAGFPNGAMNDYWGKPVRVSIDTGSRYFYRFVGYIDGVRPQNDSLQGLVNSSPFQVVTITCLGASYAMRGANSRSWSNYRLSDIANEMAFSYGFSIDCAYTDLIHEHLIQAGESDWKFLTRTANIQGLSVTCHGTRLHIFDPSQVKSRLASYHYLYTIAARRGDPTPAPGQILNFKANFGAKLSYTTSVVTADGTALDLDATGTPTLLLKSRSGVHDMTVSEGLSRVDARTKKVYNNSAEVRVLGVAGCVPGGVVRLDGLDDDIDDFWYVTAVTHTVTSNGDFISNVSIVRNSFDPLKPTNVSSFIGEDVPKFSGTGWRAAKRYTNVYT